MGGRYSLRALRKEKGRHTACPYGSRTGDGAKHGRPELRWFVVKDSVSFLPQSRSWDDHVLSAARDRREITPILNAH